MEGEENMVTTVCRNNGNRIQRLLFTEYRDFEDMVLIESPFAQTTREGLGIRQIQMGLTPTKLILASDVLCKGGDSCSELCPCRWWAGGEGDEDELELISVCPVEWVNVSVFRRHSRHTLKARFCNNKVLYFELAGSQDRQMFWNLWCERVKFLCPEEPKSTQSETSVGSSTSGSTMTPPNAAEGQAQPAHSAGGRGKKPKPKSKSFKWADRNLFLGPNFESGCSGAGPRLDHAPAPRPPQTSLDPIGKSTLAAGLDPTSRTIGLHQVNRFGQGIDENCRTGLYLHTPYRRGSTPLSVEEYQGWCERETWVGRLVDDAVLLWERGLKTETAESAGRDTPLGDHKRKSSRRRHKRRYSLQPLPHFMYGLGPWKISRSQAYCLQLKRASSEVSLTSRRERHGEPEFRLGLSRRQLAASWSAHCLLQSVAATATECGEYAVNGTREAVEKNGKFECGIPAIVVLSNRIFVQQRPPVMFWTPGCWYRPMTEKSTYGQIRAHMKSLRDYLEKSSRSSYSAHGSLRRRLHLAWKSTRKKKNSQTSLCDGNHSSTAPVMDFMDNLKMDMMATNHGQIECPGRMNLLFKSEQELTTWDFNSTVIAYQLTLIDRDLFQKLTENDLMTAVLEGNTKNAPNLMAMIAFSHRTANLVSSQILSIDSVKMRARMVARYINVADKLHRLRNLQSATSVLYGLQAPSVFRLNNTWNYIRARHSTKYQRLWRLLKMYAEPRSLEYGRTVERSTRTEPYIPSVPYVVAALLAKLAPGPTAPNNVDRISCCSALRTVYKGSNPPPVVPKSLKRCISPFRLSSFLSHCDSLGRELTNTSWRSDGSGDTESFRAGGAGRDSATEDSGDRVERATLVGGRLVGWQRAAHRYALPHSQRAHAFLTAAHYGEEMGNFYLSLRLEPRPDGGERPRRQQRPVEIEDSPSYQRL